MLSRTAEETGQATVEWTGLTLLVSLLLGAVLTVAVSGGRLPGAALATSIAGKLLCAAQIGSCADSADAPLVAQYGEDDAALVRRFAPDLIYEDGSRAVPVDFRQCRSTACGDGPTSGAIFRTDAGLPTTAFTHVVHRDGNTYVQYWLYYADSASMRGMPVWGKKGFHLDDWESFQIRVGPDGHGVDARASSHHGYNGTGGMHNWLSDAGVAHQAGWMHSQGRSYVSGGSHAGHVSEGKPFLRIETRGLSGERLRRAAALNHLAHSLGNGSRPSRWTPHSRLRLVPIEPMKGHGCGGFAISPPWCKKVYDDPEYEGTD